MGSQLVSVVTPAYMAEDFIESTIRSVWLQRHRPLEHIVVVDASPDATADRAHLAAQKLGGEGYQLHIVELQQNGGTSVALNTGISQATGDYVCWLSADDLFANRDKTSRQLHQIMSDDSVAGVFDTAVFQGPELSRSTLVHPRWARRMTLDPGLRRSRPDATLMAMMFSNPINGTSIMLRRSAMPHTDWFDPTLGNYSQDGDLWMRMMASGRRLAPSVGAGTFYRRHPGQHTNSIEQTQRGSAISHNRILLALHDSGRLLPWLRKQTALFALGVTAGTKPAKRAHMQLLRTLVPQAPNATLEYVFGALDAQIAQVPQAERDLWPVWLEESKELRSSPVFQEFEASLSGSAVP